MYMHGIPVLYYTVLTHGGIPVSLDIYGGIIYMYNVGEAQMTWTDTCMCACILHKKGPSYIKGEMGVMKYKETYMYTECAIHSHRHLTTVLPLLQFTTECITAYFNLESALIIL